MAEPREPSSAPPASRTKRGRGRPGDRSGEETRAVAITVAQRRFGAAGYRGVSMESLAAECGVDARALYHHFGSKRGLFDVAREEALDRFAAAVIEHVFSHADARHRLAGYLSVLRTLHTEDPCLLP